MMKTKEFLCLMAAMIIILLIAVSCSSTKKLISRSTKTTDSISVENKQESHKATNEQQLSIIVEDSSSTWITHGYMAVKVDSGNSVILQTITGYDKINTSRPTIIFFPNSSSLEKKATVTKDHSVVKKTEEGTKAETKTVAVKSDEKTVNKNIEKKRTSWVPMAVLIICIFGFIYAAWAFGLFKKRNL